MQCSRHTTLSALNATVHFNACCIMCIQCKRISVCCDLKSIFQCAFALCGLWLPIGRDRRTVTDARTTHLYHRTEPCRQPQTTHPSSIPTRPTPMLALSRVLVSTHAHRAADRSVSASQMSQNQRSSAGRSCRRSRPRTAACFAPKLAPAPALAMPTAREHSQATEP